MSEDEKKTADFLLSEIKGWDYERRTQAVLDYKNFLEAVQIRLKCVQP